MALSDRYEHYENVNGKMVGYGNMYRKCSACRGEFLVMDNKRQTICSDCDERLSEGDTVREVILEGGEALRLNRGLELTEEDFEPPTGEVKVSN